MRKLQKYRDSAAVKAAVFLASLLVCLTVLELGLRLAGVAVASSRQNVFVPPPESNPFHSHDLTFERYRPESASPSLVLTFGDSLTNGGNVESYESYPYHLYQRFADSGRYAAVYNMGKCEDSTYGVSRKFKDFLRTHPSERPPAAAVVLVGAADLFNIPLVRERIYKEDSFWHDVFPRGWPYTLRLYKVYRHIKLSLSANRLLRPHASPEGNRKKLALLLDIYARHKARPGDATKTRLSPELAAEVAAAFPEDIRLAGLNVSRFEDFADLLTQYASIVYSAEHRYDDYFSLLLDLTRIFPEDFLMSEFQSINSHFVQTYRFIQAYQIQSRHTAREVLEVLDAAKAASPESARHGFFRHMRRMIADRKKMDRFVDKERLEAWEEIVRLSRENGIRLVLMNYPVAYKSANDMLARVSKLYGLPLIDNRKYFAGLIAKDGREKYLEDDDHLTPLGYELLAANAFSVLGRPVPRIVER